MTSANYGRSPWIDDSHQVWSLRGDALVEIPPRVRAAPTRVVQFSYVSSQLTGAVREESDFIFNETERVLSEPAPPDIASYPKGNLPPVIEIRERAERLTRFILERSDLVQWDEDDPVQLPPLSFGELGHITDLPAVEEFLLGGFVYDRHGADRFSGQLFRAIGSKLLGQEPTTRDSLELASAVGSLVVPIYGSPPESFKTMASWLAGASPFAYSASAQFIGDTPESIGFFACVLTPAIAIVFRLSWPAVAALGDNVGRKVDNFSANALNLPKPPKKGLAQKKPKKPK